MNKSIITETPSSIGTPQVRWNEKSFNDLISDKGGNCYIERAMRCPCRAKGNGSPLSNCQNCGATGWFFVNRQKTDAVTSALSNKSKYEVWSEANTGMVNISIRPVDKLAFMDKITMIDLEVLFSQNLYLNTVPSSPIGNFSKFAFTVYEPIHVHMAYLFVGPTLPLIHLSSSQYQISGNKVLIDHNVIPDNIQQPNISICYTHHPVFHVIEMNRDAIKQKDGEAIDASRVNFPVNAIGKKAHYILDASNFNGDNLFDNTDYSAPVNNYNR